jgi:hypothetical protein
MSAASLSGFCPPQYFVQHINGEFSVVYPTALEEDRSFNECIGSGQRPHSLYSDSKTVQVLQHVHPPLEKLLPMIEKLNLQQLGKLWTGTTLCLSRFQLAALNATEEQKILIASQIEDDGSLLTLLKQYFPVQPVDNVQKISETLLELKYSLASLRMEVAQGIQETNQMLEKQNETILEMKYSLTSLKMEVVEVVQKIQKMSQMLEKQNETLNSINAKTL